MYVADGHVHCALARHCINHSPQDLQRRRWPLRGKAAHTDALYLPLGCCCGRCAQGCLPWQTGRKAGVASLVAGEAQALGLPVPQGWAQQVPQADPLRVRRPGEDTGHHAQVECFQGCATLCLAAWHGGV